VSKEKAKAKAPREDGHATFAGWHGKGTTGNTWDIYCGDALEVLKTLPAEQFNCVVTSPPYFWLRDYNVSGQIGHEDTVVGFVNAIASVMDEVYRVLRKDGLVFLNLGDTLSRAEQNQASVAE
jgi:DNA modification methylase